MRVDYLGLEAFVAIADFGSFQRAAEALSLSQAALSHRLKKIEEDLGGPLLIRSSREVSLTALGQSLLPDARRLLKELLDAYASVRAGARRSARWMSFACLPSIANSLLPAVLADLVRERPEIAFEVLDIPVSRIAAAVREGKVEFGVTIVSAEQSDLRVRALAEEDYVLFLPLDHPLAEQGYVTLPDLRALPIVGLSSHSRNRQLLDMAFGQLRDHMSWRIEVQTAPVALRIAAEGAAATIQPRSALRMAPDSLVALPFKDVKLSRTLGVVSRRGVPLSDVATETLKRIEDEFERNFGTPPEIRIGRTPGHPD